MGRPAQAAELLELALATARAAGHHLAELAALTNLGRVHFALGTYEVAAAGFRKAVEGVRRISDRSSELEALCGLAWHHLQHGGPAMEQAIECFEQSLHISRAVGNERGSLASMIGLAWVHRQPGLGRLDCAVGRPERALTHHHQALGLATRLGQSADEARAHDGLAHAHRALSHPEQARRHWQRALEILTDLGADITEDEEASTSAIRSNLNALVRRAID